MSNSSTTTENDLIEPIHLGETLMEDFIEGLGITQHKLSVSIGVAHDDLRVERRNQAPFDAIQPLTSS